VLDGRVVVAGNLVIEVTRGGAPVAEVDVEVASFLIEIAGFGIEVASFVIEVARVDIEIARVGIEVVRVDIAVARLRVVLAGFRFVVDHLRPERPGSLHFVDRSGLRSTQVLPPRDARGSRRRESRLPSGRCGGHRATVVPRSIRRGSLRECWACEAPR
jgi:hypothetical protein